MQFFKSLRFSLLVSLYLLSPPSAFADVNIQQDNGQFSVRADGATLQEIANELSIQMGMELQGNIEKNERISIELNGDFKEIVSALFGEENYILTYNQGQLTDILVFDGAGSNLIRTARLASPSANSTNPQIQAGSAISPTAQPDGGGVLRPADLNVRQVGDEVTGAQMQKLAADQASAFGRDGNNGTGSAGAPASDVEALQRQTTQNLQGLIEALNALCPPGNKC